MKVGTARYFFDCAGKGGRTVIFEAGAGGWSIHMRQIQKELASSTRVCVYDRAGLGKSSPGTMPRTAESAAIELGEILRNSGEKGPFILAGHSFGGYVARIFHDRHPELIAGVVLIDSAHPEQWERIPAAKQMLEMGVAGIRQQFESVASGKAGKEAFATYLPGPLAEEFRAAMMNESVRSAYLSEIENAVTSAGQARYASDFGEKPLVVLSAGNSFAAFLPDNDENRTMLDQLNAGWLTLQADLASHSKNSTQIISRRATHTITAEDPKLVAAAVRILIDKTKGGTDGK